MWKKGEIAPKDQFLLFPTLFYIYIFLTSTVKLHIHLLNVIVQFIVFLTLSILICRGTDISKYFSEYLGYRDNESRLQYGYSCLYLSINTNIMVCKNRGSWDVPLKIGRLPSEVLYSIHVCVKIPFSGKLYSIVMKKLINTYFTYTLLLRI